MCESSAYHCIKGIGIYSTPCDNKRLTLRSHEAKTLEKSFFFDFLNYDYKWMEHLKTVDVGGWGAKTLDDA